MNKDVTVPPTTRDMPTGNVAPTSRDVAPLGVPPTAREDGLVGVPPTARDVGGTQAPDRPPGGERKEGSFHLPPELSRRYQRVVYTPKPSGEADIYLLKSRANGEQVILKWYRPQINPKSEVLKQVSGSDPDHVIGLIEHGRIADDYGDSRYYEILEYAEGGSLQDLIANDGPRLDDNIARDVLSELFAAVSHLHDQQIVHRDLKPGNILIRRRRPLDLILTDFGISSVVEGTSRMTSFKGTCPYVSPEAMQGQVSAKSDYWSIGMILVEILTGAHPFRLANGHWLDDQSIKVHIATRGIDVSGIAGRWQRLCRGLLHRDPALRWGKDEVTRWLDGEDNIPLADDARPEFSSPPLMLGEEFVASPLELAPKLAVHWEQGKLKLERGDIGDWLRRYWSSSEPVLIARVEELEHERNLDADSKLFRLITYLDPQADPTFRGYGTAIKDLAPLAKEAVRGDAEARSIVSALFNLRILPTYARLANKTEYSALEDRWRADVEEFEALRTRVNAQNPIRARGLPTSEEVNAFTLAAALSPEILDNARRQIGSNQDAAACSWFTALGDINSASTAMLLVMHSLAPIAAAEVQLERQAEAERNRLAREAEAERKRLAKEAEAERLRQVWKRRWSSLRRGFMLFAALGLGFAAFSHFWPPDKSTIESAPRKSSKNNSIAERQPATSHTEPQRAAKQTLIGPPSATAQIRVPTVIGTRADWAKPFLEQQGLTVKLIGGSVGKVTQQEPGFGALVPKGSAIELRVQPDENVEARRNAQLEADARERVTSPAAARADEQDLERQARLLRDQEIRGTASRFESAKLEAEINQALRNAGATGVSAEVGSDFSVILKGSVTSAARKDRAFQIARQFRDVANLKDRVFVVEQ